MIILRQYYTRNKLTVNYNQHACTTMQQTEGVNYSLMILVWMAWII